MSIRPAIAPQRTATLRRVPFALAALFVVVGCIAAIAYAINSWQVYGFADHVWQLPRPLCFGAAVVADALSLAGLFATYLLRDAPGRVRAYAWAVFLAMTGLSIAAAETFAVWRRLSPAGQAALARTASMVAAPSVVVALALAAHLLIVVRRYVVPSDVPALPARVPVFTDKRLTGTPGVAVTRTAPAPQRKRKRDDRRDRALALLAAGRTAAEAGSAVGVSAGTVRTWLSRAGGRDALRVSTEAADGAGVITEAPEAAAVAAFPKGDHDPLHVTDLPSFRRNGHNGAAVTP